MGGRCYPRRDAFTSESARVGFLRKQSWGGVGIEQKAMGHSEQGSYQFFLSTPDNTVGKPLTVCMRGFLSASKRWYGLSSSLDNFNTYV